MSGAAALAQNPTSPDTTAAKVDTTNNLVMTTDTTREVKHVVKKGDTLWDLARIYLNHRRHRVGRAPCSLSRQRRPERATKPD